MKTGLNDRASGSAYVELGATKGRLTCEFKFAPFSCHQRRQHQQDQEEKEFSSLVVQALSRAVRLVHYGSSCLVDPSLDEEERVRDGVGGAKGHVTVVYLSSLDEVTSIRQTGCMLPDDLMMAVDAGIESCLRLKHRMKCVLCT
ncbi:Exosome complex component MTR3 [Geodia barretti]|nr:Exosome complex component MTR3 [Geodia barretti]